MQAEMNPQYYQRKVVVVSSCSVSTGRIARYRQESNGKLVPLGAWLTENNLELVRDIEGTEILRQSRSKPQ
jgi:hypothetical protein